MTVTTENMFHIYMQEKMVLLLTMTATLLVRSNFTEELSKVAPSVSKQKYHSGLFIKEFVKEFFADSLMEVYIYHQSEVNAICYNLSDNIHYLCSLMHSGMNEDNFRDGYSSIVAPSLFSNTEEQVNLWETLLLKNWSLIAS